MPGPEKKISLLLTGGADNRSFDELISPVIQPGQAPKLKRSVNTRLSKRPGTVTRSAKFTDVHSLSASSRSYGMVPSKAGKNTVVYRMPDGQFSSSANHVVISGDGGSSSASEPGDGTVNGAYDNGFLPARVSRAGALPPIQSAANIAVGYNATSGILWHAYPDGKDGTNLYIGVSASTVDGRLLGYSQSLLFSYLLSSSVVWLGITCHGATGDRLWYASGSGICYRTLDLVGKYISPGSEVVVVVPGSTTSGIAVVSDGGQYAYLAHCRNGVAADGTLRRVDVTNGSTTHSVHFVGAMNGGGKCSVHYGTIGGANRVGVAFSSVTAANTTAAVYDQTLSVVTSPFTIAMYGHVSIKFLELGAAFRIVIAISREAGDPRVLSYFTLYSYPGSFIGTEFFFYTSAGALDASRRVPWMALQTHGATWTKDGDSVPLFTLGRCYGNVAFYFGQDLYPDDACHVTYAVSQHNPMPIARYGTVRSNSLPAWVAVHQTLSSSGMLAVGDLLYCVYKKMVLNISPPVYSTGRYVLLDLSPHQPRIADDRDGASLVSGAFPVQFDGQETTEIGGPSLHAPKHFAFATGGGSLSVGVYRTAVVYQVTDVDGNTRRSRPGPVITTTIAPGESLVRIYVLAIEGMLRYTPLSSRVQILMYGSELNGSTLHLFKELNWIANNDFMAVDYASAVSSGQPQIYTTATAGEEIPPQPPPPLRDVSIVGGRAWGVDAEFPTRLVHSKFRVAGVGYEFVPAGDVLLPSGAGECYAVREWQGLAIALCDNGVYQISGEGPNNTGTSGAFSAPVKISDVGCSNTDSVALFPGGIVWQQHNRFVTLSAAGIDYVPDFNCEYDVTSAVVFTRHNEVLFFSSSTAEIRVYNYLMKRWTTWDSQTLANPVQGAVVLPWDDDKAFVYCETSGTTGMVRRVDADSVSAATNMTWDTDHFLLGGDFQDHVIVRDVILNGAIAGAHSVTIELYMDYETTPSRTQTWSSAQLDAIDVGGRYTVRLEPSSQNCRAMRIKVYDAITGTSDGMAPRSLTIVYALEGLLYETAFVEGSRA